LTSSTTEVGRRVPPSPAEDAQSEVSEGELWEWGEREEEMRAEAEELGAEVEEPLFLPTPTFFFRRRSVRVRAFLIRCLFCFYLDAIIILLGQAWAEGK